MGSAMQRIVFNLRCLLIALFALSGCTAALAQPDYPAQPIKLVVPFGAGTTADIIARVLGDLMGNDLGKPVVIENKPGASGVIGAASVAIAEPDGYTLVLGTIASHGISTLLMQNVTYDPVKSFDPIMLIANVPNMLVVNKDVPVSNISEFVTYAKKKRDLNFTSPGVGTTAHLAGELMRLKLGLPLVHVPYKSGATALTDVISGQVPVMIWQTAPLKPQIDAGTVKPISALTLKRIDGFPNVPTLAETLLPGFDSSAWFGILAPAKTPAPILKRIYGSLQHAMSKPEVRSRMHELALEPETIGPEQFRKVITDDLEQWRAVLAAIKLNK
jgi:tripartite-type tricarboxylate transporter receptor subunit TctC